MISKSIKIKKELWIFVGFLILLFLMFGWRQFYGFNKNDEIFYISTVYRFFQGDGMLVHEWNNVQLFAFLTYPLFCLIRLFHPSNEGIVLIFRFSYLVFQVAVAVYCYWKLKRFGKIRVLPALFYFVTTPYNINGLSYNTLAFGFVLLTLVTITANTKLGKLDAFLCGIFIAAAVLANPYTVLLFAVYGVICFVKSISAYKQNVKIAQALDIRTYVWMCAGAFLIFVLFCCFVLSRGSLSEILENLTYIVMDSERQKSLWEKFAKYFIRIYRYYKILVYVTALLLLARCLDRKKKIPVSVYLGIVSVVAIPYIIYYGFFWEMVGINYMLIPLAFPGLIAYVTTEEKDKLLFWGFYLPALIYTLLAHFATNTGIYTVSAAYMIADVVSILFIWKLCQEQKISWLRWLVILLFMIQFVGCIWQRMSYVWGDEPLEYLTYELKEGPLKGIYTSEKNAKLYEDVLQDMEDLQLSENDHLFVLGIAPWMYLNTEAKCGAYSTWETLEDDPLIPIYYELRPEKMPTVIYCYEYEDSILETQFAYDFIKLGYEPVTMRRGVVLQRR